MNLPFLVFALGLPLGLWQILDQKAICLPYVLATSPLYMTSLLLMVAKAFGMRLIGGYVYGQLICKRELDTRILLDR